MNNKSGLIVAFEGISGSGKSTIIKGLEERLGQKGAFFKFPQNSRSGIEFKRIFLEFPDGALKNKVLQIAAFSDFSDSAKEIKKAKENGRIAILDRFYFSCFAYQNADRKQENQLFKQFFLVPRADVVVFVDCDPQVARERILKRQEKIENSRFRSAVSDENFQKNALANYEKILKRQEKTQVLRINGEIDVEKNVDFLIQKFEELKI